MITIAPLGKFRQAITSNLHEVRQSRFLQDKLSSGMILAALAITLANVVFLLSSVHPASQGVSRYNNLYVGYTLGPWYFPYVIAAFALGVTFINVVLAYQAYTRSRLASFFLLAGNVVVSMFAIVIANALGHPR